MNNHRFKISQLVTVFILGILALLGLQFVLGINSSINSAEVTIVTAPQEVKLSYDGAEKTVSEGDKLNLKPGLYDFKFSKENFVDDSKTVRIDDGAKVNLTINLEAANPTGGRELTEQVNLTALQGISDVEFAAGQGDQPTAPRLSSALPFKNFLFSIDYRSDSDEPTADNSVITIQAVAGYRQAAVNQLSNWGFQPDQLNIQFTNYKNPFN